MSSNNILRLRNNVPCPLPAVFTLKRLCLHLFKLQNVYFSPNLNVKLYSPVFHASAWFQCPFLVPWHDSSVLFSQFGMFHCTELSVNRKLQKLGGIAPRRNITSLWCRLWNNPEKSLSWFSDGWRSSSSISKGSMTLPFSDNSDFWYLGLHCITCPNAPFVNKVAW